MVFHRASDALAAAIDGRRDLEHHAWPEGGMVRVRTGLHTGEALASDAHYVGREVHRVSRICDAGLGGQILVSQMTAAMCLLVDRAKAAEPDFRLDLENGSSVGEICQRLDGIPLAVNHLFTMIGVVDILPGRPERTARLFSAVRYLGGAADLPIPFRTSGTMSFYRTYLPRVREALGRDEAH